MKKLILALAAVVLSVSSCGWYSFCDPKSPNYDPQLCRERMQEVQMMQMQNDINTLKMKQFHADLERIRYIPYR
jgi:hypothetical protein